MELISLNAVKLQGSTSTLSKKVEDATVKPTTKETSDQNSVNEANSHNKYDTLELSDEYLEYKTKSENSTVKSDTSQSNSTIPKKLSGKPAQQTADSTATVASDKTTSQPVTDDSEEAEIDDLTSYSASELKTLVQEGKITTAEYNAEIKSRKEDTKTTTEQSNTAVM